VIIAIDSLSYLPIFGFVSSSRVCLGELRLAVEGGNCCAELRHGVEVGWEVVQHCDDVGWQVGTVGPLFGQAFDLEVS